MLNRCTIYYIMNSNIPQHVAIIPDGNRRWARNMVYPASAGMKVGAERMFQTIEHLMNSGVRFVTVWVFPPIIGKGRKTKSPVFSD